MSNATFTFGRFNPPTEEGHGKLVSAVQNHAEETGGQHYIFPTHSQDKKKNPMSHDDKVGAMRKLFPSANIVSHDKVRTAIDAMKHLESKGHKNVTMVVGSDRVDEFHTMLNKYREKEYPGIKKVNVVSAGHRDPDAEGAEGMSASKLRGLVASGKKKEFVSNYSDPKLGAQIHDKVKAGMQMESTNPVGIFLLGGPGSGKDYVLNNIFSRFDLTEVQVDQIINGSANELFEQKKNIVINGSIDEDKIAIVESILDGYNLDTVYVSVTNKVSRLRNALRDNPLNETKRIEKFLAAEKLAESVENSFVFNNSINLNESSEMERVFFGSQIEKLLARLVEHGLTIQENPKPKSFVTIKEKYSHSFAQQAAIAIAMKKAGKKPKHMKEDIRYAEKTVFPPMQSVSLHAERIAEKHGVSPAEILDHLAAGISVEYTKTRDYDKAMQIAIKNLEKQSDYYSKSTTVEEQLQRPKVPAMRYVPTEAERVKASQQRDRQQRVKHRWFDHKNADVHSIAKEAVEPTNKKTLAALRLGAEVAKKDLHSAGDTGNPVQEEKDFPPVKHHKSGLPSKYVAGLTPAEIQAKKATISRNARLSDSNPEAYKDMPGDKRIREKGIPQSKYTKKYHEIYGEEVELDEGAADTSLSAKSKKSGVSLATLRKVYNRGVAAWNSGHRPGTTPAQWGHARVNSYITHGKTYHTADKDLHEEQKVTGTNCKNCIYWNKESEKPVDKNELNENGGLKAPNDAYLKMSKEVDLVSLPGKATVKVKAYCDNDKIKDFVTERMCCALWDGEGTKREYKGDATFMENVDLIFERQFDGTSSYREYAIAMTPGQSQEIKDVNGVTQPIQDKDQCGCGGGCDCNSIQDSPTGASGDRITRSLRDIKKNIKEAKSEKEEKVIDVAPVVQTKRKKGNQVRPINTFDSTLQGMPTVSTAFAEEVLNEEVNDDWFKNGSFETSKKAAPIKYETAEKAGTVQTLEGPVNHEAGHKIITGPKGEKYPVSPEKFKEYYHDHGDGTATPKPIAKQAKVADHDGVVHATWGDLKYEKGKHVIVRHGPGDYGVVEKGIFNQTYDTSNLKESVDLVESILYHMENDISLIENVYRPGSDKFFEMIKEAKRLYAEGNYTPADDFEKDLLQSDIGEKAIYEGKEVWLDFPVEDLQEDSDPTNGHGIGKPFRKNGGGAVYVKDGGKVHLVNFSQSGMKKRINEPGRVRSFVARHHCLTNNDKTSAEYWACRWPRYFSNTGHQWW